MNETILFTWQVWAGMIIGMAGIVLFGIFYFMIREIFLFIKKKPKAGLRDIK